MTFDECIQRDYEACRTEDHSQLQYGFFCGSSKECQPLTKLSVLQKAKSNVEKYYSVVGITSGIY